MWYIYSTHFLKTPERFCLHMLISLYYYHLLAYSPGMHQLRISGLILFTVCFNDVSSFLCFCSPHLVPKKNLSLWIIKWDSLHCQKYSVTHPNHWLVKKIMKVNCKLTPATVICSKRWISTVNVRLINRLMPIYIKSTHNKVLIFSACHILLLIFIKPEL